MYQNVKKLLHFAQNGCIIHTESREHTFPYKKGKREMFYVINYESGEQRHGNFDSYSDCLNYAESRNGGYDFTIEEYDSEEDYYYNL